MSLRFSERTANPGVGFFAPALRLNWRTPRPPARGRREIRAFWRGIFELGEDAIPETAGIGFDETESELMRLAHRAILSRLHYFPPAISGSKGRASRSAPTERLPHQPILADSGAGRGRVQVFSWSSVNRGGPKTSRAPARSSSCATPIQVTLRRASAAVERGALRSRAMPRMDRGWTSSQEMSGRGAMPGRGMDHKRRAVAMASLSGSVAPSAPNTAFVRGSLQPWAVL